MTIEITYDGGYPSLCSGRLVAIIDGKKWDGFTLSSGGSVTFDENWSEHVTEGEWAIYTWPEGFPEDAKAELLRVVNEQIPHGCCGGCV